MSMDDPQKIEASFRETIKARCSLVPYVTSMLTMVGNFQELKLDQPPDPKDFDPLGYMTKRTESNNNRRSGPRNVSFEVHLSTFTF